tara:strand:+ start:279 stop:482 length:204 start_codon:yes stop_codon:yes gene_type:complete
VEQEKVVQQEILVVIPQMKELMAVLEHPLHPAAVEVELVEQLAEILDLTDQEVLEVLEHLIQSLDLL